MTEFSPPEALIAQNEQATTQMRINAWSHREHVKPIMARIFAAAARRAMELRAKLIDDMEATGIEKFYYQYATLTDRREVNLASLLHFPLHTHSLPVDQAGLPEGQQLTREYSVALRIGGAQLKFGTDTDLKLSQQYMDSDGASIGEQVFSHVLRKDAVPETLKVIEQVTTQLKTVDDPHDYGISTATTDNYYLKTQTWIPNLSKLGRPDIELGKITDISFSYNTSYDTRQGTIDKYGSMSDTDCARRLTRLVEITRSLLEFTEPTSHDAEPFTAIAARE